MDLRKYIRDRGITKNEFARRVGCSFTTIHNILRGYDIKLSLAERIEKVSEGQVHPQDLYPKIKRDKVNNAIDKPEAKQQS